MSEEKRETLSAKKPAVPRDVQQQMDWQDLMGNQAFLRTLFTILASAGMFSGANYQPVDAAAHFAAGRRGLGLDILRTAEKYLGPSALLTILEAEKKALKETSSDNRSGFTERRNRELGGVEPDEQSDGPVYLNYGDR